MVDIQTERVLNVVIDALFDDANDCPKKRIAYQIMENIKRAFRSYIGIDSDEMRAAQDLLIPK
jgi:hypothetical protein